VLILSHNQGVLGSSPSGTTTVKHCKSITRRNASDFFIHFFYTSLLLYEILFCYLEITKQTFFWGGGVFSEEKIALFEKK
jgi:hypothetical protein